MGIERVDGCWLWVGGPVVPGAAAMTFGRLILVRRDAADDALLLRHEREHVTQWRTYGVGGFLVRYLRPYFAVAVEGLPALGGLSAHPVRDRGRVGRSAQHGAWAARAWRRVGELTGGSLAGGLAAVGGGGSAS